ncbi:hypothetical protein M0R36_11465 [bacterium]|jgi:hypothetical protein|nr:hypothetical protein [bacterium]
MTKKELEDKINDLEFRISMLEELQFIKRYDKAFEDLAKLLGLKCWTGCKICFDKGDN